MRLHIGVVDIPYSDEKSLTTGDVAEILEAKYHPMEVYYRSREQKIADDMANGMAGALESLLMGAPPNVVVKAASAATASVGAGFKEFLESQEMESMGIPGVPTKAALKGVNHRLKHPYSKTNAARPSFIDTGQYQASATSWIDGNE